MKNITLKKKEKTCQHLIGRSVFCCTFSPFIGSMLLACEGPLAFGVFVLSFAFLRLLKYNIVPTRAARTIPTSTPNTIVSVLFL